MSKSNNEVYIPLSDTNIVNLAVREDFFPGNCDTCEYGQKYVQDVRFETEDDRSFVLEFEDTYHYPVSVAEFTQLLINNLDRYETMDYAEFKAEMKDLEDRAFSDIKQKLNPQEIGESESVDQNADQDIEASEDVATPAKPYFANKDVYAFVQDPTEVRTKVTWDVRNHKDANDELISDQAERWGRTAIKVVEKGVPTYANASADQLREIPRLTQSMNYQSSIVRDTYQYVQKGLDLSDYNLQQSLGELEYTDALEQ